MTRVSGNHNVLHDIFILKALKTQSLSESSPQQKQNHSPLAEPRFITNREQATQVFFFFFAPVTTHLKKKKQTTEDLFDHISTAVRKVYICSVHTFYKMKCHTCIYRRKKHVATTLTSYTFNKK